MVDNRSRTLTEIAALCKGQEGERYLGELWERLQPVMGDIASRWQRSTGIDREDFLWSMAGDKFLIMVDKFSGGSFFAYAKACFNNACADYVRIERGRPGTKRHEANKAPALSMDYITYDDSTDDATPFYNIIPDTEGDPLEEHISEMTVKKFLATFAEASEKDGKIIRLLSEGYTNSEIKEKISGSIRYTPNAVRLAVYHARNRFAEYLIKQELYTRSYIESLRKAS